VFLEVNKLFRITHCYGRCSKCLPSALKQVPDSFAWALALFSSCFHSSPFDTSPFHLLCPRSLISWSTLSAHFSVTPHTIVCLWRGTSEIYLGLIIVLNIDIPTQLEPGSIDNKCKIWVKDTLVLPTETSYRNASCHNCLSWVPWTGLVLYSSRHNFLVAFHPVVVKTCPFWANHIRDLQVECSNLSLISSIFSSVSAVFSLFCFLSKERHSWAYFSSPLCKLLMKLELKYQDTCGDTYFYTINLVYFSHRHYTGKKNTSQMYVSPSQFSTVHENMKQISVIPGQKQRELIYVTVNHLQLQSEQYKMNGKRDTS
jgi:hypothetical protein